jgi:hypothetical protein
MPIRGSEKPRSVEKNTGRLPVIPQDDGLMDLWIAGLLGLSSRKTIDLGF